MTPPALQPDHIHRRHQLDDVNWSPTCRGPRDFVADVGGRRRGARPVQVGAGEELPEGSVFGS
eukprot:5547102-Pyramimonas_sp.AAC.1